MPDIPIGAIEQLVAPRAFRLKFKAENDLLKISALGGIRGRDISDLDLFSSTWDGTPLASLENETISVTGDFTHRLVLRC